MRNCSYVLETGNTSRSARAGRGMNKRREGSSMENTSWKERVVERPSLWRREDITSGLFSREGLVF